MKRQSRRIFSSPVGMVMVPTVAAVLILSCPLLHATPERGGRMQFETHFRDDWALGHQWTSWWEADRLLHEYPLEADVTYLSVPWRTLYYLGHLYDTAPIKVSGPCFTLAIFDWPELLADTVAATGVDVLLSPHATRKQRFENRPLVNLTILPIPYWTRHITPALDKDILYSFVGGCDRAVPVREKLWSMRHSPYCTVEQRKMMFWYYSSEEQEELRREYGDVMGRSRFSLCPKGNGIGTVRFWESLSAGAIPVIIGSDDLALPLDGDLIPWDEIIIRIDESEVEKVPEIIAAISPEREERMRSLCYAVGEFFSGPNKLAALYHYYGCSFPDQEATERLKGQLASS